jgi:hypothetical protein
MAMNFIQMCGDVEGDAGPPIDDVKAGTSDVDPGKTDVEEGNADVACHVSRGLCGFHSTTVR